MRDTIAIIRDGLARPVRFGVYVFDLDNSGGASEAVAPLTGGGLSVRRAVLKRVGTGTGDTTPVYLGDATTQEYPLDVGEKLEVTVSSLDGFRVRVPAGVHARVVVYWEA